MIQKNERILWGLFILRFGLSIFLAMWAIDKLVMPATTVEIFKHFYLLDINASIAMLIGAVELVLSLLIFLGMYKTATYGLGLVVHLVSTVASYEYLMDPFGRNHLFIASIPVLFAFITLFLCRETDTKLTLGKKKSIFT